MPMLRKVMTSAVAMVASSLMLAGVSSAASAGVADDRLNAPCNVNSHPTQHITKNVWRSAPSYKIFGDGRKEFKGNLSAGDRWFYCQKNWGEGYRETVKDAVGRTYTNTWWALTNVGNVPNVWVNVIYLTGGSNNQPEPGLPQGT